MNHIRSTFIVTLAFSLLLSACGALQPGTPAPSLPEESSIPTQPAVTEAPAPTELPIETQAPEDQPTFAPATYRDESAGIEFDYPAGWAFDGGEHQSRGYFIQLYSWDWKPGDPIEPLPVGGTVLAVTVQLWDPKNDLEAFINQRKLAWDSSGISILSEERVLLTGNRPAAQFIVQGIDGSQAFFAVPHNLL